MSRILIITAVFPPEPVVSAMLSRDIADELSKNNEVVVLCPPPSRPEGFRFKKDFRSENYSEKYKVLRLSSYTCSSPSLIGRFKESYSFGKHCARYILEHSGDIDGIYINSWPLFSQYIIIKIAKKLTIPCINQSYQRRHSRK